MLSVTGTFKVLSFMTVLFVLQIKKKNLIDNGENYYQFSDIIFIWFMPIKPGFHISRKDRKHMLENKFFKLSSYDLVSIW